MKKLTLIINIVGLLASAYGVLTQLVKSFFVFRRSLAEEDLSGAASSVPEECLLDKPQTSQLVEPASQGPVLPKEERGVS